MWHRSCCHILSGVGGGEWGEDSDFQLLLLNQPSSESFLSEFLPKVQSTHLCKLPFWCMPSIASLCSQNLRKLIETEGLAQGNTLKKATKPLTASFSGLTVCQVRFQDLKGRKWNFSRICPTRWSPNWVVRGAIWSKTRWESPLRISWEQDSRNSPAHRWQPQRPALWTTGSRDAGVRVSRTLSQGGFLFSSISWEYMSVVIRILEPPP